jgi:hypothetical protein
MTSKSTLAPFLLLRSPSPQLSPLSVTNLVSVVLCIVTNHTYTPTNAHRLHKIINCLYTGTGLLGLATNCHPQRVRERYSTQAYKTNISSLHIKSWSNPITGLDRPWGFQGVETPRFQDIWHMKVVRSSALLTSRLTPPPGDFSGTYFC